MLICQIFLIIRNAVKININPHQNLTAKADEVKGELEKPVSFLFCVFKRTNGGKVHRISLTTRPSWLKCQLCEAASLLEFTLCQSSFYCEHFHHLQNKKQNKTKNTSGYFIVWAMPWAVCRDTYDPAMPRGITLLHIVSTRHTFQNVNRVSLCYKLFILHYKGSKH